MLRPASVLAGDLVFDKSSASAGDEKGGRKRYFGDTTTPSPTVWALLLLP